MSLNPIYVGADVGASRTKVAVLDSEKNLIGHCVKKSGTDFTATANTCLASALKMGRADANDVAQAVSTGYGRKNVAYSQGTKTEIGCHAKGSFLYFPFAATVIDIGGQDNKIIKLDANGMRC